MVTQNQVDTFVTDLNNQRSAVESVFDADEAEVRSHPNGQVEIIVRNRTKPGMADGTYGTADEPADVRPADKNANATKATNIANELRSLGGDVDQFFREHGFEVFATFQG